MNCKLSKWSGWSSCSSKCGTGVVVRTRNVATKAQHGGQKCVGKNREQKSCSKGSCRKNISGTS